MLGMFVIKMHVFVCLCVYCRTALIKRRVTTKEEGWSFRSVDTGMQAGSTPLLLNAFPRARKRIKESNIFAIEQHAM